MGFVHTEMHASMRLPDMKVIRASGMTPNFEHQGQNLRAFVGLRMNHSVKLPKTPSGDEAIPLETTDEVETLPYRKEYVQAIAEGHLLACDEKTARAAAKFGRTQDWKQFLASEEAIALAKTLWDARHAANAALVLAAKARVEAAAKPSEPKAAEPGPGLVRVRVPAQENIPVAEALNLTAEERAELPHLAAATEPHTP